MEEDKKIDAEMESVSAVLDSDGWQIIENKLIELINERADIGYFEEEDPNKLMIELKSSKKAINLVKEWIDIIKGMKENLKALKANNEPSQIEKIYKIND